jgi:predicted  nucleic acid-binding Zn-ribbon protein
MANIKTILGTDTVSLSRITLNENFASINQQLNEFSQLFDGFEGGSGGSFNGEVTTNIIPNQNEVYDLGSETNRFRDLYLSNNTIYLGNNSISMSGNNMMVNGRRLVTDNRLLGEVAERARLLGIETSARTQAISNVTTQISSLADSTSAMAQTLTNLNTTFEAEIATAVGDERLARIEAVSDINQTLTSLSNANQAIAESITDLGTSFTSEITDALGAESAARTEAISNINQTLTSLSNDSEAIAESITNLNSSFITAIADAVDAEKILRTEAISNINQTLTTLNDANSALAESVTTLEAQYTIEDGSITGFKQASALKTAIDSAIATANEATVTSTTELIAELGDQTSAVTETMTANIDALTNKVNAQYTIEVDANGNVAGIKLGADETGSSIAFTADSFKVSTGGPQGQILTPFSIIDGQVAFNGAVSFSEGSQGPAGPQGIPGTNGLNGANGLPGTPGANGISTYFHIAYADNATGGGFSQSANGKLYIGTYVDNMELDAPAGSSLWKWQLVKGSDGLNGANGLPGTNGVDGQTSYLHIAYANNSTGTLDFHVSDSSNRKYLGTYTDFTEADSTNPALYKWTLVKGTDGAQGPQGPAPDTSQFLTTSTTIDGGKITTGIIKNGNFAAASPNWDTYSTTGFGINLDLGAINSKNFYIDPAGNAKFRGDIDSDGATIKGSPMTDLFTVESALDEFDVYRPILKMRGDAYIGSQRFSNYAEDLSSLGQNFGTFRDEYNNSKEQLIQTTLSHVYIKRNDSLIETGDLVKLDENNELVKAASVKDTAIVGILWEEANFSITPDTSEKPHHYRDSFGNKIPVNDRDQKSIWRVASIGDSVDVDSGLQGMKVCNQNGPVLKGDLLCSSDIPGYAMKQPVEYVITGFDNGTPQYEERQTINSFTLGKCMEDCAFDSEGKATGIYGYLYCG